MEVMNSVFLHFSLFSEDSLTSFFFLLKHNNKCKWNCLGFPLYLNEGRHENIWLPELVYNIAFKNSYIFSTYLKLPQEKS